ncbi:MAG: glycosyltransferase family 4 protein [Lentisphaerae bacterium]|nr:glycosyltransferase family 4 protein [Lentisphaerota bacterium]
MRGYNINGNGRRPRVCVLRHGYYPADVRVYKEVRALVEAGMDVDVICLRERGEARRETIDGISVCRLAHAHRRGSRLRYVYQYGLSVVLMFGMVTWRALRRRYAVIQVNTMPDALVFTTVIARLFGTRILLDMHEPMPELFMAKYGADDSLFFIRLQVWIEQAAMRYADGVLTVNDTIRRRFIERGAAAAKIRVVRNVPGERFAGAPTAAGPRGAEFRLVTHGTLQPRYGQDVVIRALPRLVDAIPGIRLTIIGDGETRPELEALARELGCADAVAFRGHVPFAAVPAALAGADAGLVTLMPSPFADLCQPNKLFEYAALRIPVVAARFPAIEEMFDDTCLTFFRAGDAEDLCRAIREVRADPEGARKKAENAYRRYEPVRWQAAKADYLAAVRALMPERNAEGHAG